MRFAWTDEGVAADGRTVATFEQEWNRLVELIASSGTEVDYEIEYSYTTADGADSALVQSQVVNRDRGLLPYPGGPETRGGCNPINGKDPTGLLCTSFVDFGSSVLLATGFGGAVGGLIGFAAGAFGGGAGAVAGFGAGAAAGGAAGTAVGLAVGGAACISNFWAGEAIY